MLELLPGSSDPNMYIEIDGSHMHIEGDSKWSLFIQVTLMIAERFFWSTEWLETPTAQRFPQLSSLFKDVLRSFLDRNADVNVIVVDGISLENRSTPQGAKETLRIIIEETVMSYIMRQVKCRFNHSMGEIEDLFRSKGGLEGRSIRYVLIGPRGKSLGITMNQSERLLKELPPLSAGKTDYRYSPWDRSDVLNQPRPVESTAEAEDAVNLIISRLKDGFYEV